MTGQDTTTEITDDRSFKGLLIQFATKVVRAVFTNIPATIMAILIGAFGGGLIGLTFGPLAPLFALGGALFLGLPVAIWEYKIKSNGESLWEIS